MFSILVTFKAYLKFYEFGIFYFVAVIRASNSDALGDSGDWIKNGAGRLVSHSYGFGLIDANAIVNIARVWKNVPEQKKCQIKLPEISK